MSLHLYKPLTSNDPGVRLKAASQLTAELLALVERRILAPIFNLRAHCHLASLPPLHPRDLLTYSLTRLIKGLASGHASARFGFAVVLTELLSSLLTPTNSQKWSINLQTVLDLIHKWLSPAGAAGGTQNEHLTKSEERDRWLGRLFGLKAVVMCGCLFPQEQKSNTDTQTGQEDDDGLREREFRTVLTELLSLGTAKPWLREPGLWALASSLRKFSWPREYVKLAWKLIADNGLARTSEGVGVWLCFEELHPGATGEEAAAGRSWDGGRGPLARGSLPVLAKVLKESGAAGAEKGAGDEQQTQDGRGKVTVGGKGVWSPQLHWVWDEILKVYIANAEAELKGPKDEEEETPKKKKVGKKEKDKDKDKDKKADCSSRKGNIPTDVAPFEQFWRVVVDESLFSAYSSEERKFHGFLLLIKILTLLTTPTHSSLLPLLLPPLFTRNLLRCLINHLSDPARYLHKSAQKVVKAMQGLVEKNPYPGGSLVLRGLVLGEGTTGFDALSKSRTVERVLVAAGTGGEMAVQGAVEVLREIILTPQLSNGSKKKELDEEEEEEESENEEDDRAGEDDEKENIKSLKREEERKRQWAADQILILLRSGKVEKTHGWVAGVVDLIVVLGHFDLSAGTTVKEDALRKILGTDKLPTPKVSDASREIFRARLSSVLGHLLSLKESQQEQSAAGRDTWPYRAVRVIRETLDGGATLAMEFDSEIEKAVDRSWKRLEGIRARRATLVAGKDIKEGADGSGASQLQAFELLYSLVLLQTYNGDSDAVELLEELEVWYGNIVKAASSSTISPDSKKIESQKATAQDGEDIDISAILVDLLLSFLAKPSVLLRKLAGLVWSSFVNTSAIGRPALEALLGVLETKESLDGQQTLFDRDGGDHDGEDEGDGEEDDDDMDLDSDAEMITPTTTTKGTGNDTDVESAEECDSDVEMSTPSAISDDDGDDASDDETDLPTDEETAKFEAALGKALKTRKVLPPGQDPAGDDHDEDEDSDADMTDSEMMQLDAHLSTIFRERLRKLNAPQSKKKDRADARQNVVVFKSKVLDLLEGYVKGRFGGPFSKGDGGVFLAHILPRLLGVMRLTSKPQLRERVAGVVRMFVRETGKHALTTHIGEVALDELWATLAKIHGEVLREGGGSPHTAACSTASISVVKAILKATSINAVPTSSETVGRFVGVYSDTMTKWLVAGGVGGGAPWGNGGSTLQIQKFFTDFVVWGGSVRKAAGGVGKKNEIKEETDELVGDEQQRKKEDGKKAERKEKAKGKQEKKQPQQMQLQQQPKAKEQDKKPKEEQRKKEKEKDKKKGKQKEDKKQKGKEKEKPKRKSETDKALSAAAGAGDKMDVDEPVPTPAPEIAEKKDKKEKKEKKKEKEKDKKEEKAEKQDKKEKSKKEEEEEGKSKKDKKDKKDKKKDKAKKEKELTSELVVGGGGSMSTAAGVSRSGSESGGEREKEVKKVKRKA
ncbi:DNA polymerase phi-domain-containing protein [Kalaharituber pfeilii]|nr:DNA polymerase phi-domain-containing protein [Kalaharituber pfeilii]